MPFPAQFRQQGANLIPPKHHNPKISNRINNAIMTGMELLPNYRPQSIAEWLQLLIPEDEAETVIANVAGQTPPANPQMIITPPTVAPSNIIATPHEQPQGDVAERRLSRYSVKGSTPPQPKTVQTNIVLSTNISDEVAMNSAVGIDYAPLQALLKSGKWKEADQETAKIILKICDRERSGWLDTIHIQQFPCEDLQTIDQLWGQSTSGRFSFSAQKRIYEKLGGKRHYDATIWAGFGSKVGWRKGTSWLPYKDLNFSLLAPEGHLPMFGPSFWGFKGWVAVIATRLSECQL